MQYINVHQTFTMNPQTQFAAENAFNRFLELIREIVESSGKGNCIYRGEPKHYDKVASAPYRPSSPSELDSGVSDLDRLRNETLKNVQNQIHDNEKDDFEHLTVTQHYGGQTDLIDFTTDYKIALFFACNGFHDKDGRVIVLPRTEDIDRKYRVKQPLNVLNRVKEQKSIFTQPHNGIIEQDDFITVNVPANLKQWILIFLRFFYDISTQSLFNDIYGYIQENNNSRKASLLLAEVQRQLRKYIDDNNLPAEEKQTTARKVIGAYTKALQYSPYNVNLYVEQGKCYLYFDQFDCAVETFSKAILLQSNHVDAYVYRGTALLHLQDWENAKFDFEAAKAMSENVTILFHQFYASVEDFEQKTGIQLPEDIAAMLTSPQP